MRNEVSPYSPRKGKLTARKADGNAGKDSAKSECRIVMMRIGVSTSPHAKAGRLAHGSPICKRI